MNNIENTYTNYDELVSIVKTEVIESRIQQISQEMLDFLDTLYYYMKFRQCDAQSIELMLLAFKAGQFVSM